MIKLPTRHNFTTQWTQSASPRADLCSLAIDVCEFAVKHCFRNVRVSKTVQVLIESMPVNDSGNIPLGTCSNSVSEGIVPGIVTITISPNQTHEEFVNTLLHEFVHAQQIFEGRLSTSRIRHGDNPTITLWNKRAFSTRTMEYLDYPWEIEARYEANRLQDLMDPSNAIIEAIALMTTHNEPA